MSDRQPERNLDAVVVGAGFAGLYSLHKLRGLGLTVRVFEAASGVGGTWFWNRYPGARCDIESMEYSYQFSDELQQEWEWSERYASQPEILRYANHVTERFDLRRDIRFETRVISAHWNEQSRRWDVQTDRDDRLSARFCIMATGCLSSVNTPDFEGLDSFAGPSYHTGKWPHEGVDFVGARVGLIGTGSSAIQATPIIAQEAEHLFVFQRTANFSIPAHNAPLDPQVQAAVKAEYSAFRERSSQTGFGLQLGAREESALSVSENERQREFESRWRKGGLQFLGAFEDLTSNIGANDSIADFVRGKIREVVDNPELAELLSPDTVLGCKRLCVDTNYYATFNRPNVTLVDVKRAPIQKITPAGLETSAKAYEFDTLVLATGFDAMTGALLSIDIRGRGGETLGHKWEAGPRTYLGLSTAGFPNFFTITGPGSPSVLSNMIPSIEQHVNWIAECIGYMRTQDFECIEATVEAENEWVDHVNEVAGETLFPSCNSWYLGANIPGKPRVFMPYLGFPPYVEKCNEVTAKGYEGFALS